MNAMRSLTLRLPRRRRSRVALAFAAAMLVYLIGLSAVPSLLGRRDDVSGRRERAARTMIASNWALVPPTERAELSRAVDDAWRELSGYRMRYVTGPPERIAADQPESDSRSEFRLDGKGRIAAQRDTNVILAESPASGGREERFEGYRFRSDRPHVTSTGRRIANAEVIYQRILPGLWTCERVAGDAAPPPAPGIDFRRAGDGGFSEIDGRRVRAFEFPEGAFGLRSTATVWIELDTLRVRRQLVDSPLKGRQESWTYSGFDEQITPVAPSGVPCRDG